jgi:hypothetical protein
MSKELLYIIGGIIVVSGTGFLIVKRLITFSVRILTGILTLAFVFILAPKVNTFLLNRFGHKDLLVKRIAAVVDADMESNVISTYQYKTGIRLDEDDASTIALLKEQAFSVDPNLSDNLNIFVHSGYPQEIIDSVMGGIDPQYRGSPTIQADSFSEYVAELLVLKIVTVISYLISFEISHRLFKPKMD